MKIDYKVDIRRLRTHLGEQVKQKATRITQNLVDDIVRRTPVYRGHLRASWNVTDGFPVYLQIGGGTPQNPLGPPKIVVRPLSDFPVFYITNGQPYAMSVEKGGPNNSPHGMVRVSIASLR